MGDWWSFRVCSAAAAVVVVAAAAAAAAVVVVVAAAAAAAVHSSLALTPSCNLRFSGDLAKENVNLSFKLLIRLLSAQVELVGILTKMKV